MQFSFVRCPYVVSPGQLDLNKKSRKPPSRVLWKRLEVQKAGRKGRPVSIAGPDQLT